MFAETTAKRDENCSIGKSKQQMAQNILGIIFFYHVQKLRVTTNCNSLFRNKNK